MTTVSLNLNAHSHRTQFGIHNVVYKRQAWGIAPCFLPPQSVIALAKASLLVYRLVSSCPVYNTPSLRNCSFIILDFQKCRYHSTQINASEIDYSFFVISIHFAVEKDLGLQCARVSTQAQASSNGLFLELGRAYLSMGAPTARSIISWGRTPMARETPNSTV